VLAGRGGYQGGSVTVNKCELCKEMKRSIGYVMQSDLFFTHLSVRDTLTYTALLRLPGTWSHQRKVEEVFGRNIYVCDYN
jgi:ABC-type multidrug transport system ATPase subunit